MKSAARATPPSLQEPVTEQVRAALICGDSCDFDAVCECLDLLTNLAGRPVLRRPTAIAASNRRALDQLLSSSHFSELRNNKHGYLKTVVER